MLFVQQSLFDFKYDDEDTVMNEIEEFYSYIEMPQVAENMKAWEGSFHDGMSMSPKLALPLLIPCLQENGQNHPFLSGGPMSITSLKV